MPTIIQISHQKPITTKVDTEKIEPILLKRDEAAKLLRVSEKTIFNLTTSGKLPCVRIGRNVRYSLQTLHDFINSNEVIE